MSRFIFSVSAFTNWSMACCSSFISRSISSSEAPLARASCSACWSRRSSRSATARSPSSMRRASSHSRACTLSTEAPVGSRDQPALRHLQAEDDDEIVVVGRRLRADGVERAGDRAAVVRIGDQPLALLDHRARDRVMEDALRQHDLQQVAGGGLSDGVLGGQLDPHRQAGPGVRRQVVVADLLGLARVGPGEGQRQQDLARSCRGRSCRPRGAWWRSRRPGRSRRWRHRRCAGPCARRRPAAS